MNNDEILLLAEILKWQKLQGLQLLRTILPNILESTEKRKVYELTDGQAGVVDISKKAGVATDTISNWWNNWLANGVLTKENSKYKKIISLKDIGLSVTIKE
jgi:hypothetical protein